MTTINILLEPECASYASSSGAEPSSSVTGMARFEGEALLVNGVEISELQVLLHTGNDDSSIWVGDVPDLWPIFRLRIRVKDSLIDRIDRLVKGEFVKITLHSSDLTADDNRTVDLAGEVAANWPVESASIGIVRIGELPAIQAPIDALHRDIQRLGQYLKWLIVLSVFTALVSLFHR